MVTVSAVSSDRNTAWRIRDALAIHPLLGGASAKIDVYATHDTVVIAGWTLDKQIGDLALRLATRSAGRRAVHHRLTDGCPTRERTRTNPTR